MIGCWCLRGKMNDERSVDAWLIGHGMSEGEKKKGQLHKVFRDSFDAKPIYTRKFLLQKIQYIHFNPVKGEWKLANDWREYEHSSASFYELNRVIHYEPLHYDELY
jgi:hypothetical protein